MLLQKLAEYSERTETEIPPALYAEGSLRYTIDLGTDGRFLGMIDHSDSSSRATRRGRSRLLPQVQRTSGIRPLLLASPADYTLGIPKNPEQAKRAGDCHAAYVRQVERCAAETEEPSVTAVLNFISNQPAEQLALGDDFDAAGVITFRVDEQYVIDIPAVQDFWASINQPDGEAFQCLVCGKERPALERLQSKIKGIPGGQTSGTSIISANSDAFESYGLKASQVAPTCSECAESFTRGANALLSSEGNRFRTSSGAFVFWTREPQEFDVLSIMSAPDTQDVLALLESVQNGLWSDLDETAFYALSLSATGGRAAVRDWMDTTVRNVKENLALWFRLQQVAPGYDEESRYYGLMTLANSTVRDRKDLPVTTPRTLIRTAFKGEPLPRQILGQAIGRCQAERKVTRPRAALIKLTLLSQDSYDEEDIKVDLNTANIEPGYLCGRLLYVLERAQRTAIPGVNATVVDRYYGNASTAPQSVFPLLLKGARAHLSKLNRDNRGAQRSIELEIEEILANMDNFPKTLSLEQQGLFALGYYHQRSENQRQVRAAGARLRAQQDEDDAQTAPE